MQARGTERAHFWRAHDLGADLLRAKFEKFSYDLHTHDSACLALITEGSIRIRMPGAEFVARKGDLYAIDPDQPHAGWPVDQSGWSQRTIYVDLGVLHSRVADIDAKDRTFSIRGPIIRDETLAAAFAGLHTHSETGGPRLERDEAYLRFACRLFARHTDQGPSSAVTGVENAAVRRAKAYLDSRLDERVSLSEIAAAANLAPFRLYRSFERETGMTPHAYQRQARIRLALQLLRHGNELAEIAATIGFADQAHFTRSFRSRMGITPGAYRDAVLSPS
ncbi:AraC family transcriptional regulator [Aureimonas psammosilenae]|uniref:AraC family transcriptional regulator n=1 Tax=Aureimonas psammosilenae TaxID=2495496 RepID=UPI0012606219|nr:AraC family transcriptional regulator [Aureimonas psammosilenae]